MNEINSTNLIGENSTSKSLRVLPSCKSLSLFFNSSYSYKIGLKGSIILLIYYNTQKEIRNLF